MKATALLLALFLCIPACVDCHAQEAVVKGKVIDAATGEYLPGVHVFMDQTLRGTSTDGKGAFQIDRLPAGSYTVVASMVGFSVETISVEVAPEDTLKAIDFKLNPLIVELGEIKIEDRRPRGWKQKFRQFQRMFLGASVNGRRSAIKNRFVLDFELKDNVFIAQAAEPLVIENKSLGYEITFVLTDFRMDYNKNKLHMQGPFYFTEMEAASKEEAEKWQTNRARTYKGSLQHLLKSLINNNHYIQGYTVRIDDRKNAPFSEQTPYLKPIEGLAIVEKTALDYVYRISFEDFLYVEYQEDVSWIHMSRDEAHLHTSGYVYAPAYALGALTVYGAFSERRVADLLPRDYDPVKGDLE